MGFWLPGIVNAKRSLNHVPASKTLDIPKGYFVVYVGGSQKKRSVIPISWVESQSSAVQTPSLISLRIK
ncbi:unnamed protein product [Prunus armeniaca]